MLFRPNVKINLGLRVLGARPDGFHELQTVFLPCYGFSDALEVVPSTTFEMEISGPEYTGWDPSEDLCARAWRLLRADFSIDPVYVSLEKGSPVGAGLGGGSADGAFMLMALNEVFSLGLSRDALAGYAAMLGSDCPFFIYGFPMYATGRGEVLTPVQLPLDGLEIKVEVPRGVHVSTKEAYAGLKESSASRPKWKADLDELLSKSSPGEWKNLIFNDFEPSVFAAHPEIAALKARMYADGAIYAAMSGSGSAVFGIFEK